MAKGAILWANLADGGVITPSAAYTTLPATFLQTPQLDQRWRTNDGAAAAHLICDLGSAKAVDLVALLATNLTGAATAMVRVSTVDATGVAGNAHDSGTWSPNLTADHPHLVRILTAPVTGRYVRVDLADATLTRFEAGRLVIGQLFRPVINFTRGYVHAVQDASRIDESIGGQEWVERRPARRGLTVRWPALTVVEQREHARPLMQQRSISQDIGIVTDTASAAPGEDLIWGLAKAPPQLRNAFLDRAEMELTVVERAWR